MTAIARAHPMAKCQLEMDLSLHQQRLKCLNHVCQYASFLLKHQAAKTNQKISGILVIQKTSENHPGFVYPGIATTLVSARNSQLVLNGYEWCQYVSMVCRWGHLHVEG